MISLKSFISACFFLMFRYTVEFCILTLYPETLLNSFFKFIFMSFQCTKLYYLHIMMVLYIPFKSLWYFFSFWSWFHCPETLIKCWLELMQSSLTYYWSQEKAFNISPLSTKFDVGCCRNIFNFKLKKFLSVSSFLQVLWEAEIYQIIMLHLLRSSYNFPPLFC